MLVLIPLFLTTHRFCYALTSYIFTTAPKRSDTTKLSFSRTDIHRWACTIMIMAFHSLAVWHSSGHYDLYTDGSFN